MSVESVFPETVQHSGSLVKGHMTAAEYAARTARIVAFFDHGDLELPFGEKTCCRKSGESAADHNDIVLHKSPLYRKVICVQEIILIILFREPIEKILHRLKV